MKTETAFQVLLTASRDARITGGNTAANEILDATSALRLVISDLTQALSNLVGDAEAMDSRLLVGQPNPGCEKGSIRRAKSVLAEHAA